MTYRPYVELFKAFIPTIVMVGATSVVWRICDQYEKKYGYTRPVLKIASGFPLYFLFLAMHFFELNRSSKALKRLNYMKKTRKC